MAEFREKHKEWVDGQSLPFECVLVNLANIPDRICFAEPNVEAAVGILVMKHAFDSDGMKGIMDKLAKMLSKMGNSARATLAEKINLYLGEYIDEEVIEELRMQKSIGQVLGIPTAGDRRRAAERAARRDATKREREKNEVASAARDKKIAEFLQSIGVSKKNIATAMAIK